MQTQRVQDLKKEEKINPRHNKILIGPWLLDQQYYIIDLLHRYDALTELSIANARVLLVDATIEEVVDVFKQYRDYTPTYEPTVEEVVVVGTRATLMRAVDKQMMADGIQCC